MVKIERMQNELREKLKKLIEEQKYSTLNDPNKNPPYVTSKHGKLKSKRKSKPYSPQTVDDLATMEIFDEETIVNQLYNRFMQTQIYTYIGDILLSVNPFSELNIYNEKVTINFFYYD
jgi:myosin heavy subunit